MAYIHSSEEQREVAQARERALTKAERTAPARQERARRPRRQDPSAGRHQGGTDPHGRSSRDLICVKTATRHGRPTITWTRDHDAIAAAAQTDGIYALATNIPGKRLTAGTVLRTYKGQQIVERRHRDYKQTLKVRPIFLHNDDRIYALTSIIGIALLIFGLIETELRKSLDEHELLPGLLPENRAAKPTGRNILSLFQGLSLTYTSWPPTRPTHPHPTPRTRTPPHQPTMARANKPTPCPHELRKMGLAVLLQRLANRHLCSCRRDLSTCQTPGFPAARPTATALTISPSSRAPPTVGLSAWGDGHNWCAPALLRTCLCARGRYLRLDRRIG